ncbi:MAG: hypothetical protein KKB39_00270 [Nanoarchaeota archaeon]|nr:hypothetical protein [Nanoarchaeota archaeon]
MMEFKVKGAETVKNRLMRLQKNNYRSIPLKEKIEIKEEKVSVNKEIDALKQRSMIKHMPLDRKTPKDEDGFVDFANFKPKFKEELPVPSPSDFDEEDFMISDVEDFRPGPGVVSNMLKDNAKHLDKIKVSLQKVEEIKKKMLKSDNFLGLYYDLNKAEKELIAVMNGVKHAGVEIPTAMSSRIKLAVSRKMSA